MKANRLYTRSVASFRAINNIWNILLYFLHDTPDKKKIMHKKFQNEFLGSDLKQISRALYFPAKFLPTPHYGTSWFTTAQKINSPLREDLFFYIPNLTFASTDVCSLTNSWMRVRDVPKSRRCRERERRTVSWCVWVGRLLCICLSVYARDFMVTHIHVWVYINVMSLHGEWVHVHCSSEDHLS